LVNTVSINGRDTLVITLTKKDGTKVTVNEEGREVKTDGTVGEIIPTEELAEESKQILVNLKEETLVIKEELQWHDRLKDGLISPPDRKSVV